MTVRNNNTTTAVTSRADVRTLADLSECLDDELGGTRLVFPDCGRELRHRDIPPQARQVAAMLAAMGLESSAVVGLLVGSVPEFLPAAFGTWSAGLVTTVLPVPAVPSDPAAVAASLSRLADRLDCVLVAEELRPVAVELSRLRPELTVIWLSECFEANAPDAERFAAVRPDIPVDAPAIVQFTSGSTARPKGVVLSHRAVLSCLASTTVAGATTTADIHVSWVPLFHDFGLITLLHGVWSGFEHHLFSAWGFIRRPQQFVEHVSTHRATIIGGPNFAFDRMAAAYEDESLEGLDFSALRMILNGGEPVKAATTDRFFAVFGPAGLRESAMTPVYGMSEATMSVASPPLGDVVRTRWFDRTALIEQRLGVEVRPEAADGVALVSVGSPVQGIELELRDDGGVVVPDGGVGEIVLRGTAVATAYLSDPEATATSYRDGWLFTGDLGLVVAGELHVAGRRKDMIIVAGRNFFAEDVEDVVRAGLPGGRGQCVAVADHARERIVVLVEHHSPDNEPTLAEVLKSRVSRVLGLGEVDVRLVRRNWLPRTTSGKWQRQLIAKYLAKLT